MKKSKIVLGSVLVILMTLLLAVSVFFSLDDNSQVKKSVISTVKHMTGTVVNSGTNGTKANSQVIIPNETLEYSPPSEREESIPMCTLRNYPTSINHCIEWALEKFNCYFIEIINKIKLFL